MVRRQYYYRQSAGNRSINYLNGSWFYYNPGTGDENTDLWGPDADHYYEAYWSNGLGKQRVRYHYNDAGSWKARTLDDFPAKFIRGIPAGASPGTVYGVEGRKSIAG